MADLKIKRAPSVESNDRAWNQVYDDINDIINAVNNKSGTESREGGIGSDGDVRLFKDVDKSKYFIEGKFKDGWAKRELLFSDSDDASQDESINFSATESYVKPDGTVPFTSTIIGVAPSNDLHLATKKYVDDLSATKDTLAELTDTNLSTTNGDMIKYDSGSSKWISFAANFLTSYAVNDSYTGSSLNPTVFGLKQTGTSSITTLRGVRSANSNMTITLEEDLSNGAYLKFNVASPTGIQSVTGYNVGGGGYGSAITGNTGLKIADDYDSGTSTGIFFEVTDSGNDTIVTPNIVGALTDTNYYVDSLAFNTGNGVLTVGRAILDDLTVNLDGRYPTSDTNTTYTTSWVDSGDNAILRLTAGNTGSGDDDLTLVAGTNITLAPSGDNLTITANNTTNYSLVNSTGNPSGSHVLVMTSSGTEGRLRAIKPGDNITMSTTDSDSDTAYVTINASLSNATINVSEVNPLGGYLTYDSANIRFIDNGRITWSLGRPGSNVTTVTPTITNPSAADVGAIATSHAANSITSTHITVLGNTSGTNSGDQTIPTRASLGLDTDDAVAFGSITCENGFVVVDTTDESGATAGFKYISDSGVGDRVDIGWGGSYGANMELYSKSHSSRAGEFKLIYGTGGSAGSVYFTHKGTSHANKMQLTHNGNLHVKEDVFAYSSSVASDRKLKKNIIDTKYGLKDVLKLRGVDFDWKEKRNKTHDIGVIAQEIQKVIPELVTEIKDLNGNDTHLTVDYSKLVPVLIESIKELKKEIDNGVCGCRKFKT